MGAPESQKPHEVVITYAQLNAAVLLAVIEIITAPLNVIVKKKNVFLRSSRDDHERGKNPAQNETRAESGHDHPVLAVEEEVRRTLP